MAYTIYTKERGETIWRKHGKSPYFSTREAAENHMRSLRDALKAYDKKIGVKHSTQWKVGKG